MTQDGEHRLELIMVEGFSAVRGDINRLADREARNAGDITELRKEVDALQERRFPFPVIGGLCGVAAVLLSVVQVLGKG